LTPLAKDTLWNWWPSMSRCAKLDFPEAIGPQIATLMVKRRHHHLDKPHVVGGYR